MRTHRLSLGGICDAFFIFSRFFLHMCEFLCTFAPQIMRTMRLTQIRMFKITPPNVGKIQLWALKGLLLLAFTCTLAACTCGHRHFEGTPVDMPASLFTNRDTVLYYAERAYLHDDPKGCYVVGVCHYLRERGELPDEIYTVSQAEADTFLMISAYQNYQPAIDFIRYLHDSGSWQHEF